MDREKNSINWKQRLLNSKIIVLKRRYNFMNKFSKTMIKHKNSKLVKRALFSYV